MQQAFSFTLLLVLACFTPWAAADEPKWGDLTGQLIYDGEPPKRVKLQTKPGFPQAFDESLVVDPKTRGIANIFIYLRTSIDNEKPLQVHPDYTEQIKKPVQITLDERGYNPHAFLVHTNQTLMVAHRGKVAFNVKLDTRKNGAYGVVVPPDADAPYHFRTPETIPITMGCNIHPWFSAYMLLRDNPYMAVTDTQGRFIIKNLPVGEHEFQFWQEKTGYLELPELRLNESILAGNRGKGRLIANVQNGENDLGTIKLDSEQFEFVAKKRKP